MSNRPSQYEGSVAEFLVTVSEYSAMTGPIIAFARTMVLNKAVSPTWS